MFNLSICSIVLAHGLNKHALVKTYGRSMKQYLHKSDNRKYAV